MRRTLFSLGLAAAGVVLLSRPPAYGACCYFSAVGQDVNQPAQKAFLTWDPQEQVESFTVQPKFEGNARDFGMVIPTPSRPRLYEMPREFFKELAVFTILKPMPLDKYKLFGGGGGFGGGGFGGGGLGGFAGPPARRLEVKVVEAGVVGSLDYKIVTAENAADLFQWLKDNKYSYAGDEATLEYYIGKKWFFTVMKIDPMQMKRREDGSYLGEVSPTRFTFASRTLIYPLRITRISVPDHTEALFYIQAPYKMDLPDRWSYQLSFAPMWQQALSYAVPQKVTSLEKQWKAVVDPMLTRLQSEVQEQMKRETAWQPSRLEWARKLDSKDIGMLDGTVRFDREASLPSVQQLKILRGHLREGEWITKIRKTFRKSEMTDDLQFTPAALANTVDKIEYVYALPTSPP